MLELDDLRNASVCEVMARVACRLIVSDYKRYPLMYEYPNKGMGGLSRQLDAQGWYGLATWVRSYAAQWNEFRTVSMIRQGHINRARSGHSWRFVAYEGYKGTRRADPRVTNRGVSSSDIPGGER